MHVCRSNIDFIGRDVSVKSNKKKYVRCTGCLSLNDWVILNFQVPFKIFLCGGGHVVTCGVRSDDVML